MRQILAIAGLFTATIIPAYAQQQPVIDVHVHARATPAAVASAHDSLGVRYAIVSGLASHLRAWTGADTTKFRMGLVFPCEGGLGIINGMKCFESGAEFPDTAWLRGEITAGRIHVLGELVPQFMGIAPSDPRLEPYWRLAEELDVPVAIHMGPGPRAVGYDVSPVPHKSPNFRMAAGDPLLLEEVLLRHKRLRVYVMHAGWPRLESMIALMYAHPNVYVDVGALQFENIMARDAYVRHLRGLMDAGMGQRVMFGSDFPNMQRAGIEIIRQADFLSEAQKRDILCNNAARFFRLGAAICGG